MTGHERYPHVFEPFDFAGVRLRNRIFIPAHTTNFGDQFMPTDRHVAYYAERAKGGVALIFTEGIRVHPTSVGRAAAMIGYDERALPGFRRLADAVHEHGAAMFAQIIHAGRQSENIFLRTAAWGPSAVPHATGQPVPHAMTVSEIEEIVEAHVFSARLLREAGFDGLEVQMAHGHLLHQFLSPLSNVRTDEYGGSEENRLRFPLAVVRAVVEAVGDDMVVGVRISGDDFEPGGVNLAAAQRNIARIAGELPIKFVNVSHSSTPTLGFHVADLSYGPTPFIHLSLGIADAVPNLPLFAVCRFTNVELAERAIATGKIDLVGMARAHMADPYLVQKAFEGRETETRPCVALNRCIGQLDQHQPITCLMNPTVGREREWTPDPSPTDTPLSVLVVGGGAAGLEAARIAAERGHRVELWEAADELGGQIRLGRQGHGRSDLDLLTHYQEAQLRRLGVEIRLDKRATEPDVLAFGADVVIVATGATPASGHLEGWGPVEPAAGVLSDDRFAGKHVVLLDTEGNWTAASAAETLAQRGAQLTVLYPGSAYLPAMNSFSRMNQIDRLAKLGVDIRLLRKAVAYHDGDLTIADTLTGRSETIAGVEAIVAARPAIAERTLADQIEGKVAQVHVLGDANAPRTLLEAIFEAHRVARTL
ncbi:MAG: NAD-binding protein [Dehalococcoidia bacterium]